MARSSPSTTSELVEVLARLLPWLLLLAGLCGISLVASTWPYEEDELEFARAILWIGEGRRPYLDFFEHHPPLHWFLLAPVGRYLDAADPGLVGWLRLAQAPMWLASAACVFAFLQHRVAAALVVGLFFASPSVAIWVAQLRIDAAMNLCLLLGLLFAETGTRRPVGSGWFAASGVALALGCLASQRLVPLAIVATALYACSGSPDRPRWSIRGGAGWMVLGALAVGFLFLGAFALGGNLRPALHQLVTLNRLYLRVAADTSIQPGLLDWLGRFPVGVGDLVLPVLAVLGLAGLALAPIPLRVPGPRLRVLVLLVASLVFFASFDQVYPYQLPTAWWLLAIVAGQALAARGGVRALAGAALIGLLAVGPSISGPDWGQAGARRQLHEHVVSRVLALTAPGEAVLDGTGRIAAREPACEWWFLPHLVRLLTSAGEMTPCGPSTLEGTAPGAVVMDVRTVEYLHHRVPEAGRWVLDRYLPLDRFVWLPAPHARVEAGARVVLRAPRAGSFRVVASPGLLEHPVWTRPWEFAESTGPELEGWTVELSALDRAPFAAWLQDRPLEPADAVIVLSAGQEVSVVPAAAAAVLLVPAGVERLFEAPFVGLRLETLW